MMVMMMMMTPVKRNGTSMNGMWSISILPVITKKE
jgi:hypothetical protein